MIRVETRDETYKHEDLQSAIAQAKELSEGRKNSFVYVINPDEDMEMRYRNGDLMKMKIGR